MRPLWTPTIGSSYIGVTLDRGFTVACANAPAPTDVTVFRHQVFKYIVDKHSRHTRRYTQSGYLNLKSGILLAGVYANSNGLWLTLDEETLSSPVSYPSYTSHNDDTIFDRIWLLQAFDAWVSVASAILNYE
jgi:hypothetical protein